MYKVERVYVFMINYGKVEQRHFATLNFEHKESL